MADTAFFQSTNKTSQNDINRRKKMAERLLKQGEPDGSTQVISGYAVQKSPLEGLAKAVQTGLGSYMEGKAAQDEQLRSDNSRKTMAAAMDAYSRSQAGDTTQTPSGESIQWDKVAPDKAGQMYANMLMQDEGTAPMGMQAMQQNMANQQQMEMMQQKLAMEAQYAKPSDFSQFMQMSPDMQARYSAFKGGTTLNYDANGQVIPPPRKLSASEQKEVFDLQDKQASIEGALSGLTQAESIYNRKDTIKDPKTGLERAPTPQEAKSLLPQPYTGMGADARTVMARAPLIGDLIADKNRAAATTEAKNLVTEQALNNMKAIFGGNPTEGERTILLQLQALPSMTPQEQKVVIDNAVQAANRRKTNYSDRLGQIEGGNYFQQSKNPYAGNGNPAINQDYSQIQPLLNADMNAQVPNSGGVKPPPMGGQVSFNTPQEAEAANLPKGTSIMIGGRRAVVE